MKMHFSVRITDAEDKLYCAFAVSLLERKELKYEILKINTLGRHRATAGMLTLFQLFH